MSNNHISFVDEYQLVERIQQLATTNQVWRSYIGMGYYNVTLQIISYFVAELSSF